MPPGTDYPQARVASAHSSRSALVAAGVVALGCLAVTLPSLAHIVYVSNDAIGYVATARSWIAGQGFVEPILYSYYLDGARVPVPATAIRPPIISILFAIPMKLGAGLVGLGIVHAVWSAAIGASTVLVGRRFMSLPAATAAAIGVAWSPSWRFASTHLLAEATSIGALLLLFALAPRLLRRPSGGLLLAVATVLAWLVRPNLGAVAPIIALAAALHWGTRNALRSKPLWAYLLSFALLQQSCAWLLGAIFGFPPYAHYGVMAETLSMTDVRSYQNEYNGAIKFLATHSAEILGHLLDNARATLDWLFIKPAYLFVGWIGLPGLAYALARRSQADLHLALWATGSIVFGAIAILTGWGFDGMRYPLPAAVCLWLVAMAGCDRLLARILESASETRQHWLRWLVLSLPMAAWLIALPQTRVLSEVAHNLTLEGTKPHLQKDAKWNRLSRNLCQHMDADGVVASDQPWTLYYWCGNAGYLLPRDLNDLAWLHKYLDEIEPDYILAVRKEDIRVFNRSPRLTIAQERGAAVLYARTGAAVQPGQWNSLGPLHDLVPKSKNRDGRQ